MADYDGTKGGAIYDYSQNQAILGDNTTVGAIEKDPRLRLNMSYAFNIRAGVTMNRAIEATLALANIPQDRYRIENYYGEGGHNEPYKDNTFLSTVPYDLQFNVGQTWCDVWNQLAELYSSWEFFFDIDGTFVWRRIPTGKAESVVLTNKILEPLLISEKHDNSFRGIYNATEVWGKSLELTQHDRYAETSTYSNNVYTVDVVEVEQYNVTKNRDKIESWWTNTEKLGIHIQEANTQSGFKVRIRGHLDKTNEALYDTVLDVVDGDGNPIDAKYLLSDKSYVFTYRKTLKDNQTTSYLVLNGLTQAYGYYVENNPDCPYSFQSLGYLIPQRITAEALPNDAQCAARAARLTYLSCAMQDTISLETLIIPWLDVNKKISYVSQLDPDREKLLKGKESELPQYIIKNFSWSTMNGTMSLSAYRFREDYTYVVNN